ncbi:MAG: glycine zipper 2TM domain-containing protein [Corticimicrobacter sp.]|uniref:glycine zipper 2TM domain-containing protein n=1 Tax=Corticimicrobacter sp. TaxID=2678536 RepID=UPI0032DB36F6
MNTRFQVEGQRPGHARPVRWMVLGSMLLAVTLAAGCANRSASSAVYTYDQAQREQIVRYGTVMGVRNITLQDDKSSGAGVIGGGALGGVAGSAIGGGTGRTLATVGGVILGALAGNAIENQAGRSAGYEITVQLDNGETRVIAQEADVPINVGQRVRVVSGAGPTRVAPVQ